MNYFKAFKYQLYVNDPHIISSTWSLFNWLPSISTLASNRCFKISVFKIFCNPSCVLCLVAQLCLTLCNPVAYSPPGSSIRGILQARILEWVAMPSSRDLPSPGIKPRSLALQVDSLPSEPPGKPKNTKVGSLSLLQGIFLTQESNEDLLHRRWNLYQLSCQGSPVLSNKQWNKVASVDDNSIYQLLRPQILVRFLTLH